MKNLKVLKFGKFSSEGEKIFNLIANMTNLINLSFKETKNLLSNWFYLVIKSNTNLEELKFSNCSLKLFNEVKKIASKISEKVNIIGEIRFKS